MKFRVVDPAILAKDAKKREWKAAMNAKKTQPSGQKRKVPDTPDDTAVESDEMETEEREGKKRKKRNLNASAGVSFHIQIRTQLNKLPSVLQRVMMRWKNLSSLT